MSKKIYRIRKVTSTRNVVRYYPEQRNTGFLAKLLVEGWYPLFRKAVGVRGDIPIACRCLSSAKIEIELSIMRGECAVLKESVEIIEYP